METYYFLAALALAMAGCALLGHLNYVEQKKLMQNSEKLIQKLKKHD